jgi:hypothetical protein
MIASLILSLLALAAGASGAEGPPPADPPPPSQTPPAAPPAVAPVAAAPKPVIVEFRFHPPAGAHVETVHETRSFRAGEGVTSELRTDARVHVEVEQTSDGYVFRRQPLSIRVSDSEREYTDHGMAKVRFAPLTLRVNFKAELVDVVGFREAAVQALAGLPPESAAPMAEALDESIQIDREKKEWNERIGDFAGKRYEQGEVMVATDSLELPDGKVIDYRTLVRVAGREKCGGAECVRVEFAFGNELASLAEFAGASVEEMRTAVGDLGNRLGVTLSGGGFRLLEPDKMRLHREETRRKVSRPVEVPGQGLVTTVVEETFEHAWDYRAASGG